MDWMPQAIRDGIIVVLVISGPLVLAAAFIGLIIGVLQAATQVQEQTIGSALKIIGVFAIIIFAGFWMYQYLNQYTSRTLSSAFTFVPRQTQKAVPSDAFKKEGFKDSFQETIKAEGLSKPLKIISPEKIEPEPLGGVPPGVQALGTPEIPKTPSTAKSIPTVTPKIPVQPIKPKIPLADFEEPKPINVPEVPKVNGSKEGTESTELQQINLVPGEPKEINKEVVTDPLQKKEVFSESEDKPSWLE